MREGEKRSELIFIMTMKSRLFERILREMVMSQIIDALKQSFDKAKSGDPFSERDFQEALENAGIALQSDPTYKSQIGDISDVIRTRILKIIASGEQTKRCYGVKDIQKILVKNGWDNTDNEVNKAVNSIFATITNISKELSLGGIEDDDMRMIENKILKGFLSFCDEKSIIGAQNYLTDLRTSSLSNRLKTGTDDRIYSLINGKINYLTR